MLNILIIDDSEAFRETLAKELNEEDDCTAVALTDDLDKAKLESTGNSWTDVIIDNKLSSGGKAATFIAAFKNSTTVTDSTRYWLVSGAENSPDSIKGFNKLFRKPTSSKEIYSILRLASLQDPSNIPSGIVKFPLPCRVIDQENNCIYINTHWTWEINNPEPSFAQTTMPPQVFKHLDFKTLKEKTKRLSISKLENNLQLEICEQLDDTAINFPESKQIYFNSMKRLGFPRGRFYKIISTPNLPGKPQQKILLSNVTDNVKTTNGETIKPDFYQYPLMGVLKKRIEAYQRGEPQITNKSNDDKNDPGIQYWDDIINARKLESWLELPLFDGEITPPATRAFMFFDQLDSKRIDDNQEKERVDPTILVRNKLQLQQIIENAEAKLKIYLKENQTELSEKINNFDETFDYTEDSSKILEHLLETALSICPMANVGLILQAIPTTERIKIAVVRGFFENFPYQDMTFPLEQDIPIIKSFITRKPLYIQDFPDFLQGQKYFFDFSKFFSDSAPDAAQNIETIKDWYQNRLKASISIPLISGDDFFGLLNLQSIEKSYCFEQSQIDAIERLIKRAIGYLALKMMHERQKNWLLAIAHEIRSDTGPINQCIDLIRDLPPEIDNSKKLMRYINRIDNHTCNIKDLSENLFTVENHNEAMDNRKLFENYYNKIKHQYVLLEEICLFDNKTLVFEQIDQPTNIVWQQNLKGTIEQLLRVLRVLIDNAINHSNEQAEIVIIITISANFLVFKLCNSGTIPADDIKHIFDPFYQLSSTRKVTRIGLPASARIINSLGGELIVNNNLEKKQVVATLKWPKVGN